MTRRNRRRHVRKCVGCGKCCGHYLPMSSQDIERVRRYAREHGTEPRWTGIDCPWLADNKTCAVYEARPDVCKAYHCDSRMSGHIDSDPADYHIYNTERLFMLGDETTYDALLSLVAGNGMRATYLKLFGRSHGE